MKKILLFSLIGMMCGSFIGVAKADNENIDVVCTGTICGQFPGGGGMEIDKCRQNTDYRKGTYDFHIFDTKQNNSKNSSVCTCLLEDWVVWEKAGAKCSPHGAPANSGVCKDYNRTKDIQYTIAKKEDNSNCPKGFCDSSSQIHKEKVTSCVAKKCNDGFLLQTTSDRHEIDIVREEISGAENIGSKVVGSDGICRDKSWLKNFCETQCTCEDGAKCVLNEFTVDNRFYNLPNVQAFNRNKACVCVEKKKSDSEPIVPEQPGDGKDCIVTVSTDVKCKNGKTFSETKKYTISKEKLGKLPCGDLQSKINNLGSDKVINDLVENYKQLDELINEICKTDGKSGVVSGNNGGDRSMTLAEAKDILDRFFDAAENNANVWKTEEGKFNSARLASDLTAGVVLGTVGGVVSANLIKKNQIKKGYEVLHCTIGGQTVADWGDEFNTSLRR